MSRMSGALSGLGQGLTVAGLKYADYLEKSALQEEAGKITAQRDATLAAFRRGDIQLQADLQEKANVAADERRRAPYKSAATKAQGLIDGESERRSAPVSDEVGGVGPTPAERIKLAPQDEARLRAQAYEGEGLVEAASGYRREGLDHERLQRDKDRDAATDRDRDLDREQRKVEKEADDRYRGAMLKLQEKAEGRLAKGASIDNEVKEITLGNAKRVERLRTEFAAATPERKQQINEEIQLLTGKDNDNFLPVPLKDEFGAIAGYKIFDKKRGVWVEAKAAAPGAPKDDKRPPLSSFRKQ